MWKFNVSFLFTASMLFLLVSCSDDDLKRSDDTDCGTIISDAQISENAIDLEIEISRNVIHYKDFDNGFMGENYGVLHRTTDGGSSWSLIETPTEHHIQAIHFVDDQIGFIGGKKQWDEGGSIILSTTDGGQSWTTVNTFIDTTNVDKFHFYDSQNGVARFRYADFSLQYAIGVTTDGGLNWEPVSIPYLMIPFEATASRIYASCQDDKFYVSTDRGFNWAEVMLPTVLQEHGVRSMHFVNDMLGFIAGTDVVFRTDDGGISWEETSLNASNLIGDQYQPVSMHGAHFFNELEGFLIHYVSEYEEFENMTAYFPSYQGMIIFETTDGGLNWSQSDLMENCKLSANLQVFDSKNVLAAGHLVNHQIRKN